MVENDYNSSKDNTDTINDELIREISRLKLDKEIDNTKEVGLNFRLFPFLLRHYLVIPCPLLLIFGHTFMENLRVLPAFCHYNSCHLANHRRQ